MRSTQTVRPAAASTRVATSSSGVSTSAGHSSYRVWWGNTQSFKQCDGDYAGSDGWTVFIELHRVGH